MPDIRGDNWSVTHGDCRQAFRALPPKSVHCVVTSPPYWGGIRDYQIPPSTWADGWTGCYGNEPTVEQYVAHTIEVFDALGHALRDDGLIWWNIGDCYCTGKGSMHNPGGGEVSLHGRLKDAGALVTGAAANRMPQSVRAGNKALVPYRVALALQEAGWIIRQDPIWRKPSPMPESIDGWRWERCRVKVAHGDYVGSGKQAEISQTYAGFNERYNGGGSKWRECPGCDKCRDSDGYILRKGSWRPTTAHEFVFQIVKSAEYFCDANAAQEQTTGTAHRRGPKMNSAKEGAQAANGDGHGGWHRATPDVMETRNPRSVWSISSEAYKGKHFAAFPTMLAWKCIQASTSAAGCCAACGAQFAPIVERSRVATRPARDSKVWKQDEEEARDGQRSTASPNRDPYRHIAVKRTTGYRPTCGCNAGEPVPCTVADPFTGSGTTLQVAINTGRRFVGSEMAAHYLPLIEERAATPWQPKDERKPRAKTKRGGRRRAEPALFH